MTLHRCRTRAARATGCGARRASWPDRPPHCSAQGPACPAGFDRAGASRRGSGKVAARPSEGHLQARQPTASAQAAHQLEPTMARFGLDSDSSDDDLPHASGSGSGSCSAHSSANESEDEAPPRASLAQSDDEMSDDYDQDNSQLDQDEEDEDEDEESEEYVEEPSYLAQRSRSSTTGQSQTPSTANLGDDEDLTEDDQMSASQGGTDDSTRTVAEQLSVRKRVTVAGSQPGEAWGKKLGLEPKRVAVMQASFFHQGDDQPAGASKINGLGGLKRTGSVLNPFAVKSTLGLAPELGLVAVSTILSTAQSQSRRPDSMSAPRCRPARPWLRR